MVHISWDVYEVTKKKKSKVNPISVLKFVKNYGISLRRGFCLQNIFIEYLDKIIWFSFYE